MKELSSGAALAKSPFTEMSRGDCLDVRHHVASLAAFWCGTPMRRLGIVPVTVPAMIGLVGFYVIRQTTTSPIQ
jgi:hypothetical protein